MIIEIATLWVLTADAQTLEGTATVTMKGGRQQTMAYAKDLALKDLIEKACRAASPTGETCAAGSSFFTAFTGVASNPEVVSEQWDDRKYTVTVKSDLSLEALSKEKSAAIELLKRIEGKRIAVGLIERSVRENDAPATSTLLTTRLENLFRADGLKLFPIEPFDGTQVDEMVAAGKRDSIDYVVGGLSSIVDLPAAPDDVRYDEKGNRYRLRWRVSQSLRIVIVDVAAGTVVAAAQFESKPDAAGVTNMVSAEATRASIEQQRLPGLLASLRAEWLRTQRESAAKGSVVTLMLEGPKVADNLLAAQADLTQAVKASTIDAVADGPTKATFKIATKLTAKEVARVLSKAKVAGKAVSVASVKGDHVSVTWGP